MSRRVHILAGVTPSGKRWRAHCACGYPTSPRASRERAIEALETEHGYQDAVCALCGRDRSEGLPHSRRYDHVRVLDDPDRPGDQFLVCRDDEQACHDLSAQRQVHLDRSAFEAFGVETPRPTLRIVR